MDEGIVIPIPIETEAPELEEARRFWRNLLVNPELLAKTLFFNEAAYSEIHPLEVKRHLFTRKMSFVVGKIKHEDYRVAVPVGGQRKAGMEGFPESLLSIAEKELGDRPSDFPNLRVIDSEHSVLGVNELWWGDDISNLWNTPKRTIEVHRALGRAFGYREENILKTYPDPWWRRLLR